MEVKGGSERMNGVEYLKSYTVETVLKRLRGKLDAS